MSDSVEAPGKSPWRLWRDRTENGLIALALVVMMLLPLTESLLRKLFHTGVPNVNGLVQHLTLFVGMAGGVIAARERRLLSMSALPSILPPRLGTFASIFSSGVAVALTTFLFIAGWQFVQSERESGNFLVGSVPIWTVQLFIPVGFALVAQRLAWHSAPDWKGRITTIILAALICGLALKPFTSPEKLVTPALVLLLVATVLGAPVFVTLGGAALIMFWGDDLPIASIPLDHYRLVTNPTLPTIPLFTLAGYFLAEGGASKRLIAVFNTLFGSIQGGPAIVTCLVCAFFTTFTGASGVTILALGGLLMPVLVSARYSERNALGLITTAGALGLLFPPCLPLILYAIIAKSITIREIFLGGIVPGILMVIVTAAIGIWQGRNSVVEKKAFDRQEAWRAVWEAKWELLLPVVAFGGLFGGFATPVETAALTALYAFIVEAFIYRDLHPLKQAPRVMAECGLVIGGVLLILGVALGFTNYLVDAQVATHTIEWVTKNIHSPLVFLLALNIFLLIVGCLMDIYSAIIVVVPLLVKLGAVFGIHPVHLGIIFLANLELGYLTPPVGMNLFLASYRFGKPLSEVYKSVVPILLVRFVAVLVVTYIPFLSTWLPDWLGK